MDKNIREKILQKHKEGTASKQELDQLEEHANDLLAKNITAVFESDIEKYQIKNELRKRVEIKSQSKGINWLKFAASIALLFGLSVSFWYSKDQLFGPELLVVSTGFGEHKTVVLPDGSEVMLNAASELEYPVQFSSSNRNVTLKGEALFSVQKDATRPFKVTSNSVSTTVLGTVFNVKSYIEDSIVQVSLLEGSVRINQKENSLLLKPNEQSSYDVRNQTLTKSDFDSSAILAWQEKDVILTKTSFNKIKNIISRKYGVKIQFEEKDISNFTVSGTFKNPNFKTFLATICATKSLNYKEIEDNVILISKH